MTIERALRLLAGVMILLSVTLAHFVHPGWLILTAFVGANLLQSALTNWCPAVWLFKKLGLPDCQSSPAPTRT